MSPGLTAERVYDALKREISIGELLPGDRLDPARLARELGASPTPVRDALHRLLGEDLVQARAHDGFHVPVLSEAALRDLYAWNRELLHLALRRTKKADWPLRSPQGSGPAHGPAAPADSANHSLAEDTANLFQAIAANAENMQHARAVQHASERLHRVRLIESEAFAGCDEDLTLMRQAWETGALPELRRLIGAYHRRRIAGVARLAPLLAPCEQPHA